ncbi:MAG: prepilin-type N-terminal cleavage/methylation domain-containing protein [Mobilitalea sp.]
MKNNKGFTLVELIIVIAIAAIMTIGVAASMNLLVFAHSKSCANEINETLDQLRLETMSKGSVKHYIIIEWNNIQSGYYLNVVTSEVHLNEINWNTEADTVKSKKIADKDILLSYTDQSDGSNIRLIDIANPYVLIQFTPSSGAFESIWKRIIVTSKVGSETIFMVTKTGKHYLD